MRCGPSFPSLSRPFPLAVLIKVKTAVTLRTVPSSPPSAPPPLLPQLPPPNFPFALSRLRLFPSSLVFFALTPLPYPPCPPVVRAVHHLPARSFSSAGPSPSPHIHPFFPPLPLSLAYLGHFTFLFPSSPFSSSSSIRDSRQCRITRQHPNFSCSPSLLLFSFLVPFYYVSSFVL